MTLDEQIAFFFAPPNPEQTDHTRSTLHLLRREIQDCLIGKVVDEDRVIGEARDERHRLFATTMVLVSGIDLLAKFYAGSDDSGRGNIEGRVVSFAKRYLFGDEHSSGELAVALHVGFRNPISHSFTLHSKTHRMTLISDGMAEGAVWRAKGQPNTFVVSLEGLFVAFIKAIGAYEADLRASADLQAKFEVVFDDYGSIEFQTYVFRSSR